MTGPMSLPDDLPEPVDDGAAAHLPGTAIPPIELPTTHGELLRLDRLGSGWIVIYVYPMTGVPGRAPPQDWDAIPGARGCTPEACGFRDHSRELEALDASVVGISSQDAGEQLEAVERLGLPYPLASDPEMRLADALALPTFDADGRRFYKRLTLVVRDATVEHVFYPVFPPDRHAAEVLDWLTERRGRA
jgi:peroxiredoxin